MEAKIIPINTLRLKVPHYVSQAHGGGKKYIVTKNGKPLAVIMGIEEWESWKETIAVFSDSSLLNRIRKSKSYFDQGGKGKTITEVF